MKSVGNNVTDDLSPSEYGSSVFFHFIVDSVRNKKNQPPTVLQAATRGKKTNFPREHYQRNPSVCIFNGNHRRTIRRWWWHGGKCFWTLSNTDRYIPSVIVMVNINRICPSVIVAWVVIVWQLSVKYQRPVSVWKAVGMYLKYKKIIIY